MSCPTEAVLRTQIDGELSSTEADTVQQHLRSCDKCRSRSAEVAGGAEQVRQKLYALMPEVSESPVDAAFAYTRYQQQCGAEAGERITWKRPVWSGVAAACALVLLLSFAPGRTWAQKFLSMLRVQKLAVVPVDFSASNTGRTGNGDLIAQLAAAENLVITMDPGKLAMVSSLETAREAAGFNFRTLDSLGLPQQISISGEATFHITLNRDRITLFLGTSFSTLTNGVLALGLHGLAFLGGWIEQAGAFANTPQAVAVGLVASIIMPGESLWRRAVFEMQSPLTTAANISPFSGASVPNPLMIGYAAAYTVAFLALAVRRLSTRDL